MRLSYSSETSSRIVLSPYTAFADLAMQTACSVVDRKSFSSEVPIYDWSMTMNAIFDHALTSFTIQALSM